MLRGYIEGRVLLEHECTPGMSPDGHVTPSGDSASAPLKGCDVMMQDEREGEECSGKKRTTACYCDYCYCGCCSILNYINKGASVALCFDFHFFPGFSSGSTNDRLVYKMRHFALLLIIAVGTSHAFVSGMFIHYIEEAFVGI